MKIKAPAKINLFLRVVGKRADGYHDLQTLMCCVGIYDHLELTMGGHQDSISCNVADLPCDESNLALKAATRFNQSLADKTGILPEHLSIHLDKHIPAGAGMGGGSSNAAAVLNSLNQYYGLPLDPPELHALALGLGADVPFFLDGRPALATGVGERLEPYAHLPRAKVVVVYPGFGISTAEVFKNLTLRLTKTEKNHRYFPFNYGKFDMGRHLSNDLERVAAARFPIILDIKKGLLNQGAVGSLMTGSGSAVFGLFPDSASADRAAAVMSQHEGWQVFSTELLA